MATNYKSCCFLINKYYIMRFKWAFFLNYCKIGVFILFTIGSLVMYSFTNPLKVEIEQLPAKC
jgi:hypothetical protein